MARKSDKSDGIDSAPTGVAYTHAGWIESEVGSLGHIDVVINGKVILTDGGETTPEQLEANIEELRTALDQPLLFVRDGFLVNAEEEPDLLEALDAEEVPALNLPAIRTNPEDPADPANVRKKTGEAALDMVEDVPPLDLGAIQSGAITWEGKRKIGDRVIEYKEDGYYENDERMGEEALKVLADDINENHYPDPWKEGNFDVYVDNNILKLVPSFTVQDIKSRLERGFPAVSIPEYQRFHGRKIEDLPEDEFKEILGRFKDGLKNLATVGLFYEGDRYIYILSKREDANHFNLHPSGRISSADYIENGSYVRVDHNGVSISHIDEDGIRQERELTPDEKAKYILKANELFKNELAAAGKADQELAFEDGKLVLRKKEIESAGETMAWKDKYSIEELLKLDLKDIPVETVVDNVGTLGEVKIQEIIDAITAEPFGYADGPHPYNRTLIPLSKKLAQEKNLKRSIFSESFMLSDAFFTNATNGENLVVEKARYGWCIPNGRILLADGRKIALLNGVFRTEDGESVPADQRESLLEEIIRNAPDESDVKSLKIDSDKIIFEHEASPSAQKTTEEILAELSAGDTVTFDGEFMVNGQKWRINKDGKPELFGAERWNHIGWEAFTRVMTSTGLPDEWKAKQLTIQLEGEKPNQKLVVVATASSAPVLKPETKSATAEEQKDALLSTIEGRMDSNKAEEILRYIRNEASFTAASIQSEFELDEDLATDFYDFLRYYPLSKVVSGSITADDTACGELITVLVAHNKEEATEELSVPEDWTDVEFLLLLRWVQTEEEVSTSMTQVRYKIGNNKAARALDALRVAGIIGSTHIEGKFPVDSAKALKSIAALREAIRRAYVRSGDAATSHPDDGAVADSAGWAMPENPIEDGADEGEDITGGKDVFDSGGESPEEAQENTQKNILKALVNREVNGGRNGWKARPLHDRNKAGAILKEKEKPQAYYGPSDREPAPDRYVREAGTLWTFNGRDVVISVNPHQSSIADSCITGKMSDEREFLINHKGDLVITDPDNNVREVAAGSAESKEVAKLIQDVAGVSEFLEKSVIAVLKDGVPVLTHDVDTESISGVLPDGREYNITKDASITISSESDGNSIDVQPGSLEAGQIAGFVNRSETYKNMWSESTQLQASRVLSAPEGVESRVIEVASKSISIPSVGGSPLMTNEKLEEQMRGLTSLLGGLRRQGVSDEKTRLILMQARNTGWKPELQAGKKVAEKIKHMEADAWLRSLPDDQKKFHEEVVEAVLSAYIEPRVETESVIVEEVDSGGLDDLDVEELRKDVLLERVKRKREAERAESVLSLAELSSLNNEAAIQLLRAELNGEDISIDSVLAEHAPELHKIYLKRGIYAYADYFVNKETIEAKREVIGDINDTLTELGEDNERHIESIAESIAKIEVAASQVTADNYRQWNGITDYDALIGTELTVIANKLHDISSNSQAVLESLKSRFSGLVDEEVEPFKSMKATQDLEASIERLHRMNQHIIDIEDLIWVDPASVVSDLKSMEARVKAELNKHDLPGKNLTFNQVDAREAAIAKFPALKEVVEKLEKIKGEDSTGKSWKYSPELQKGQALEGRIHQAHFTRVAEFLDLTTDGNEELLHIICEKAYEAYDRSKVIAGEEDHGWFKRHKWSLDADISGMEEALKDLRAADIRAEDMGLMEELEALRNAKGIVVLTESQKADLLSRFSPEGMNTEEVEQFLNEAIQASELDYVGAVRRGLSRPKDELEAREYVIENNLHEDALEAIYNHQLEGLSEAEARLRVRAAMIQGLNTMENKPENIEYAVDFALDVALGLDSLERRPGVLRATKESLYNGAEWGRDVLQTGWRKVFGQPDTDHRKVAKYIGLGLAAGGALFAGYKGLAATRSVIELGVRGTAQTAKSVGSLAWKLTKGIPSLPGKLWKGIQTAWSPADITLKDKKGEDYQPLARQEKDGLLKRFGKWGARSAMMLSIPLSSPVYAAYATVRGEGPQVEVTEETVGEGDDAKTVKKEKVVSTGTGIVGWLRGDGPKVLDGYKKVWEKSIHSGPFKNAAAARKKAEAEATKAPADREKSFVSNIAGKLGKAKSFEQLAKEYIPSLKRAYRYSQMHPEWKVKDLAKIAFEDLDAGDVVQAAAAMSGFLPDSAANALGVLGGAAALLTPANEGKQKIYEFKRQWSKGKDHALGLRIAQHEDLDELDLMLDDLTENEFKEANPIFDVEDFTRLDLESPEVQKAMKKSLTQLLGFKPNGGDMIRRVAKARLTRMKNNIVALNDHRDADTQSKDEQAITADLIRFAEFFLDSHNGDERYIMVQGQRNLAQAAEDAEEEAEVVQFDGVAEAKKWKENGTFKEISKYPDLDSDEGELERSKILSAIENVDFDEWEDKYGFIMKADALDNHQERILSSEYIKSNEQKMLKEQLGYLLNGKGEYLFEHKVQEKMKNAIAQLEAVKDKVDEMEDSVAKKIDTMIAIAEFFADEDVIEAIYEENTDEGSKKKAQA